MGGIPLWSRGIEIAPRFNRPAISKLVGAIEEDRKLVVQAPQAEGCDFILDVQPEDEGPVNMNRRSPRL